jgi:hypothetical protein
MPDDTIQPLPSRVEQQSLAPTNKAVAATGGTAVGGAIATIVIHVLNGITGGDISADLASAITTLVGVIVAGGAAYYTPPGARDGVVIVPGKR